MRALLILSFVMLAACGSPSSSDAGAGDGGSGGGTASGGGGGGGTTTVDIGPTTRCPHVIWAGAFPLSYAGDTTPLPNWVTSNRLEWTDAPDESVQFVAPSTGTYHFAIDAGVRDLGVSLANADGTLHAVQGCPASGATFMNDGFFAALPTGNTSDLTLDAGTRVLMWISAPYWAATKVGTYQLIVTKQ